MNVCKNYISHKSMHDYFSAVLLEPTHPISEPFILTRITGVIEQFLGSKQGIFSCGSFTLTERLSSLMTQYKKII